MNEDLTGRRRYGRENFRLLFAVVLIAAGSLLFLGNLGLLPIRLVWACWPAILVIFGLVRLTKSSAGPGRFVGIALTLFGSLFLLMNFGVLHLRRNDGSWPVSMLLITFGLVMLIRALDSGGEGNMASWFRRQAATGGPEDRMNAIKDFAVLGSVKRRMDTVAFQGGEAACLFGSVEIDLRRARIPAGTRSVTVDATAVFGEVKVRIGEGWKVNVNGAGILGSFEDKTIPPIAPDQAPVLIITGFAIFGAVEVVD